MKRLTIAAACLLLATPVLAQSIAEKTGINSTLGISPSTADFVTQAGVSDLFEISSSKLAQSKGNAAQKAFAAQMIADHTKTSSELKALVTSGKVKAEIPSELDSAHQSKLEKLNQSSGDDFVSNYEFYQVAAHKDAVSLFERYAKGGDNADLKDWAGKTLPALRHHLEMAEKLDDDRSSTVGQK